MTFEPNTAFSIVKWLVSPALKIIRWISLKLFLWQERKKHYDRESAIKIGLSALGGAILSAVPFSNFRSNRQYLALIRKDNDDALESRIHIIERVGEAYTRIWASDPLWDFTPTTFEVTDIDGDGWKEIVFEQSSVGTGASTKFLYIYSLRKNKLYEIIEYYERQNASCPGCFPIINAGDDEIVRSKIIKFAHSRGFLQANKAPDFDDPAFAILRWHKENGDKYIGKVKIHWYEGMPACTASIASHLETEDIHWISHFKGPLYGYSKLKQQHFIAYSPQWRYEWVKSMASDGNRLWFVCHGIPGLFTFELETQCLRKYCAYGPDAFQEIKEVSLQNGILSVSMTHTPNIQLSDLSKLGECRPYCKLNKPHLPANCSHKKYPEINDQVIS